MATSKTKYVFWLTALAVVMACVPTFAAPSVPSADPNAISTFIVQTANAASTQTARVLPTLTPTVPFTSTPRDTETPEPTATSTVIFLFYTPTIVLPTRTPGGSGSNGSGGTSSQNYACSVVSVNPPNGTTFGSRADFDATWKIKNIGKKNWDKGSIDYVYLSGDKFHKVAGYDLGTAVKIGETTSLIVDMLSPKNPGTYTTNWTLRASAVTFCTLSLTIVVK
ncbi:MAG TPA: NBR1-Ig-like domain-containing protein [Anaerolineales bacterium]|nr:NBR1-Ig-like domain-containing protein [Anaerolineales bacterium]